MEAQPLIPRRAMGSQVAKVALAVTLGLCAASLLSSSSSLAVRRTVLVTQGIGAEEENDKNLMAALGADEGDTTKEVEEMSEEEVESAEETTEEAAAQVTALPEAAPSPGLAGSFSSCRLALKPAPSSRKSTMPLRTRLRRRKVGTPYTPP